MTDLPLTVGRARETAGFGRGSPGISMGKAIWVSNGEFALLGLCPSPLPVGLCVNSGGIKAKVQTDRFTLLVITGFSITALKQNKLRLGPLFN